MSSINVLAAQRRRARHYGIQALYQWSMTGATPHSIEAEFRADNDFSNVDLEYFSDLLGGVIGSADHLDEAFASCLDRDMDALDPIEKKSVTDGYL